jgi:uncharacterized protein (DUF305 family)
LIGLFFRLASVLMCAVLAACCRTAGGSAEPRIVQPGAPGEASRIISAEEASDLSQVQHTPADVRFMQGMIGHHAQALEMTTLVPARTTREEIRLIARRIELSQADEIKMMQEWLQARGQALPDPHAHHAPGAHLMPGMLTSADMRRLAEAKGTAFDRLFLESMIRHHDGALIMVKELLATPGAGQEPEMFAFVSDVEADQQMEIDRMAAMLLGLKERQE